MRRFLVTVRRITNLSEHIDISSTIESIKKGIDFKGPNVWILAFAIIVASVGLNVNSIPVIIGAMLISPLMGPIMGVGLAVGINDSSLLQRSLKNLVIMVAISITASFAYFFISPLHLGEPTELLARTRPTIFDVFIALFGGLAGIVESARKEKGTVIAGVAIATALMPPLCTAGYGLANGEWAYFVGAFYLFLINSVFIALATFLMVRYMKFPSVKFADALKQRRVHRTIAIFSTLIILPSIVVAWIVVRENRFEYAVGKFEQEQSNAYENTQITKVERTYHILDSSEIVVYTIGQPLTDFQVRQLHDKLKEFGLRKTRLTLSHRLTYGDSAGHDEATAAILENIYNRSEASLKSKDERIAQLEKELATLRADDTPYSQVAKELAINHPLLLKITLSKGRQMNVADMDAADCIVVMTEWSEPVETQELKRMEDWLKVRLNSGNVVVIRYSE
ncbi:MAG: DUF389 domain-containing protein [Prevotellaceae bacterium]|jgi:uncharacterized hydrophobic protein (TIGR00271 family)|nr:DUF389 domain-containing protein [Prevotellaceae bacterium]